MSKTKDLICLNSFEEPIKLQVNLVPKRKSITEYHAINSKIIAESTSERMTVKVPLQKQKYGHPIRVVGENKPITLAKMKVRNAYKFILWREIITDVVIRHSRVATDPQDNLYLCHMAQSETVVYINVFYEKRALLTPQDTEGCFLEGWGATSAILTGTIIYKFCCTTYTSYPPFPSVSLLSFPVVILSIPNNTPPNLPPEGYTHCPGAAWSMCDICPCSIIGEQDDAGCYPAMVTPTVESLATLDGNTGWSPYNQYTRDDFFLRASGGGVFKGEFFVQYTPRWWLLELKSIGWPVPQTCL